MSNIHNTQHTLEEAIASYLGLKPEDIEAVSTTWDEHLASVAKAQTRQEDPVEAPLSDDSQIDDDLIDLSSMSRIDKLSAIVDDTLDNLLVGNIALENASELIALIQAVDLQAAMEESDA